MEDTIMKYKYFTLPLSERKAYCERVIAPYKEQMSDELYGEIKQIYTDYSFDIETEKALTEDEIDTHETIQKFEMYDSILYLLDANGFPVFNNKKDDE